MPNIDVIRSAVAELANGPPLVVILPGGTTGIGSYIANRLAYHFSSNGSKLRVYIVGRKADRAKAVIDSCKKISPGSDWRFIQATDLALISEVDRSCAEIIRQETVAPLHDEPSIDLLYMSYAYPVMMKQTKTSEGLDALFSTLYYSRIRFITQLMPLLTASPLPGRVTSIYAGSFEEGNTPGSSPIGQPSPSTYGVASLRKHTCFMKTFMFESFAAQNAGKLSLTHIYPGLVDKPGFGTGMPTWFRIVWPVLKLLLAWYMTSAKDCGDVMLFLATERYPAKGTEKGDAEVAMSTLGEPGGGSYAVGQRGDVWKKGISYDKVRLEGTGEKIWDHTMDILARIEKQNARAA